MPTCSCTHADSPVYGSRQYLTEKDWAAIREGVQALKEGRITPWSKVKKELGLA